MKNVGLLDLEKDLPTMQRDNLLNQYQKAVAQLFVLKQDLQKIELTSDVSLKEIEDAIAAQMRILESKIQDRLNSIFNW